MFCDSHRMSQALDRYLTTPPDWDDDTADDDTAWGGDDYNSEAARIAGWPDVEDAPTAEELAQEAAYYAALDAQQQREHATDALMAQLREAVAGDVDDDGGYCGPTCGSRGDW